MAGRKFNEDDWIARQLEINNEQNGYGVHTMETKETYNIEQYSYVPCPNCSCLNLFNKLYCWNCNHRQPNGR